MTCNLVPAAVGSTDGGNKIVPASKGPAESRFSFAGFHAVGLKRSKPQHASKRTSAKPEVEPESEPAAVAAAAPSEGIPPSPTPSTAEAFSALLEQLDVVEYAGVLAEEGIRSVDDLRDLAADELKELGFKLGPRKRLL